MSISRFVLRVCPNCGLHADVLMLVGEEVRGKITVISREDARALNQILVQRGGSNQDEFLAAVEGSALVESVPPTLSLLMLMLMGARGTSFMAPPHSHSDQAVDYSEGQLVLQECNCHAHANVWLHLPDGQAHFQGEVRTKFQACQLLERLLMQGLPEQLEFEEAVRAAPYLSGEMPVKL